MYKVVTKGSENEVWAVGFYSEEKAQKYIDSGEAYRHLYEADKSKTFIVVPE